jgi:rSAM/selenodomain-associated transferase 2
MKFSVIIPTLNEELALPGALAALCSVKGEFEVIVADGGSSDATLAIAEAHSVRVVHSARGRGQQQATGASAATGDVLWFLHADCIPAPESLAAIEVALADPSLAGGNFDLRFDGGSPAARQLTLAYPWFRLLGLCYGDSGIFVRRRVYEAIGGFRDHPLFEDIDIVRRIRRAGGFRRLNCPLVTSSRRFENRSFALTFAHWTLLQLLYWAGVSPTRLARFYAHIRKPGRPR